MPESVKATEAEPATPANHAAATPADTRPQPTAIADPRQVAALVLARMTAVNAKKDELTIAIKGLTDITQQLTRAYAAQMQVIQQLTTRVQALEAPASDAPLKPNVHRIGT